MIDEFIVFSRSGSVLWKRTLSKLQGNPVNSLIQNVLLEDRSGDKQYINDTYALKWRFENKLDFVCVVIYQKVLQLSYVDELLDRVKQKLILNHAEAIQSCDLIDLDEEFTSILKVVEMKGLKHSRLTKKTKTTSNEKEDTSTGTTTTVEEKETPGNASKDSFDRLPLSSKPKGRVMRMGRKKVKGKAAKVPSETDETKNSKKRNKKMTKWNDTKVTKSEAIALDRSEDKNQEQSESQLAELRNAYIGNEDDQEDDADEDWSDSDDENASNSASDYESDASSKSSSNKWSLSNTSLGGLFQVISGKQSLTREDLEPVLDQIKTQLITKNVASEVAEEVCKSVFTTLEGQTLEKFTRISTVVRKALEEALLRILTPKRSTDVLREVLATKAKNQLYTMVFIGVNGVGKSTSLSKVCYYLKSKGLKVMIAACDTFRSGAVEQLNQHSKVLDVPLFQRGYAKDPAAVARDAIAHAKEHNFDCLLIDTAGRMQNNEPLMRALAKLVSMNDPNLVLFVGESLVGNDGIDQLQLFDRALTDYSDKVHPHGVDGIILTKFDTIDDKVGAAVSMVYQTGQPVVFVGTGQKYTHLKKLNPKMILKCLLD